MFAFLHQKFLNFRKAFLETKFGVKNKKWCKKIGVKYWCKNWCKKLV